MSVQSSSSRTAEAPDSDVALSSRARLARNLADFPFPHRADAVTLRRVGQEVRRAARADTERLVELSAVAVSRLHARDRAALRDSRRISPELAEDEIPDRYALLDEAGRLSIFINEEDHIRIQAILPGNQPLAALELAEDTDKRLARRLHYAQDPSRWGYLTASLSNLGSGLRLSALCHLPALAFLGKLDATVEATQTLGLSVRGLYGEHSVAAGNLYQVSNAGSWGLRPPQIAGRVRPVVDYLIAAERRAREEVASQHAETVAQQARSAWKRIENADRLDAGMALELLSHLRLAAVTAGSAGSAFIAAPDAALFAQLVDDLRAGDDLVNALSESEGAAGRSVRDAINRPARLRSALRRFYLSPAATDAAPTARMGR